MHRIVDEDLDYVVSALGSSAKRFAGKTILISGGEGFLGTHLVSFFRKLNEQLLATPVKIISVDNRITGSAETQSPGVLYLNADVTQPLELREPVHYIVHAAGLASPVYYQKFPLETIRSAVHGTEHLLELARAQKSFEGFLYFSSSEIYGDPDPRFIPTPESYHGHVSSIGPRACYDESKRLGETITTVFNERFGVPTVIVRPFNVFGPGMRPDDYRVVSSFTYSALHGLPITVHVGGPQTRTFCYVSDALAGFIQALLLGTRGGVYNIGNASDEISIKDLADKFVELFPKSTIVPIAYPDRYPGGEPQRRCPDLTRAMQDFGYSYRVSLDEGLKRFIDWAQDDERYRASPKA